MAQAVMLAEKWEESVDPTGYWMSEKLDGVRAYWDGSNFYSRNGIRYHAPKFFREALPKVPLDGELWCGRGQFQKCVSFVKKKDKNVKDEEWKFVTYLIFDAPEHKAVYEDRVKYIQSLIKPEDPNCYAAPVGIKKCTGLQHLETTLKTVLALGGEGIMLRAPRSKYEKKRSNLLLKVKTFFDEECRVTGYRPGEGKNVGVMGAIECELPNGIVFHIGTGFTDAQRRKPPKVGDVVTFKYQELSNNGHPRFPVFLRVRGDVTWAEVVENAKSKNTVKVVPQLKKQHTLLFSTVPSRDVKGNKMITDSDVNSDDEEEKDAKLPQAPAAAPATPTPVPSKSNALPLCRYGAACYQTNAKHLAQFSHPPKSASSVALVPDPTPASVATAPPTPSHVQVSKAKPKSVFADEEEDISLEETINMDASDEEDTLPMPDAGGDADATIVLPMQIDNDKDELFSEDDDKEQALISQRDWKLLVRRVETLERQIALLEESQNRGSKRPRENDDDEKKDTKKRKPTNIN